MCDEFQICSFCVRDLCLLVSSKVVVIVITGQGTMDESTTATYHAESCNVCGIFPIQSQWPWKCNVCADYYLCEGCYIGMDSKQLALPHRKDHAMSTVIILSSDRCGVCGLHKDWTKEQWSFAVCPDFFLCEDCFQGLDVLQLPPCNSLLISVKASKQTCDGCSSSPILMQRWHCKVCPDFDLCDICYRNMGANYDLHTIGHPLSAIAISTAELLGQDQSDNIVAPFPEESCGGCKMSPIWSQRPWKCNVCVDYYLCEGCYIEMDSKQLPQPHSKGHAMSAVVIRSNAHCGACGLHYSWRPQYWCCIVCPNIVLCEECYHGQVAHELPPPHNKDHLMFVKVTSAKCGGCKSHPIFTKRWHCKVCPDFDLCEVCYRELDSNQLPASHTRDHPMSAVVGNMMEWYGQDWTEPVFIKPAAIDWSYQVIARDLQGFQWKCRVPPILVMDQHGDMAPGPILQANATSTLSDTRLDVERLMLLEGADDLVR